MEQHLFFVNYHGDGVGRTLAQALKTTPAAITAAFLNSPPKILDSLRARALVTAVLGMKLVTDNPLFPHDAQFAFAYTAEKPQELSILMSFMEFIGKYIGCEGRYVHIPDIAIPTLEVKETDGYWLCGECGHVLSFRKMVISRYKRVTSEVLGSYLECKTPPKCWDERKSAAEDGDRILVVSCAHCDQPQMSQDAEKYIMDTCLFDRIEYGDYLS